MTKEVKELNNYHQAINQVKTKEKNSEIAQELHDKLGDEYTKEDIKQTIKDLENLTSEEKQEIIKEYQSIKNKAINELHLKRFKEEFEDSDIKKTRIRNNIANYIAEKAYIKTFRETNKSWVYTNPVYKEKSEQKIGEWLDEKLGSYITEHDINEITNKVKRKTYTNLENEQNNPHLIAVKNGVLNTKTQKLTSSDPEKFITQKIPWEYDPNADCPKIKDFINDIVKDEDVKLIQEMFGYCLIKDYPLNKAFMLLGNGANGKSTLLTLLQEFLGDDNVATPSLQELLEDKFTRIQLRGKLANVNADLSSKELEHTATFKRLTGEDKINGHIKHVQEKIPFNNYAKLIYAANELPRTTDRSEAFFRRWIIINFPYRFTTDKEKTDQNLPYSIITEEEMSGLLNWALEGLNRVLENGEFSHTNNREDIKREWMIQTDSLRAFKEIALVEDSECYIPKDLLYQVYQLFCDDHDAYTVRKSKVGQELPVMLTQCRSSRPSEDGERVTAWDNIGFDPEFLRSSSYMNDVLGGGDGDVTAVKGATKYYVSAYARTEGVNKEEYIYKLLTNETPDTHDEVSSNEEVTNKEEVKNNDGLSLNTSHRSDDYLTAKDMRKRVENLLDDTIEVSKDELFDDLNDLEEHRFSKVLDDMETEGLVIVGEDVVRKVK